MLTTLIISSGPIVAGVLGGSEVLKLWPFLRPYRLFVGLVLLLTFLQTTSSLYLPTLMADIVDHGVITGHVRYIVQVGVEMIGITAIGGAGAVLASLYASLAMSGMAQRLRSRLFSHVEHFTLREFDHIGTSSLIVRTTNDVMQVQQLVAIGLRMMVMAPLTAIGGVALAIYTAPSLSWIMVVSVPLLALVIWSTMGRGLVMFRSIQAKVDTLNRVLRENLAGVRVVRAFDRTPYEGRRFDAANRDVTDTSVRVFQLMAIVQPAVMLVMNLGTVVIVWLGGHEIGAGTLQIGSLMAFIQYVSQVMFSVMMVSMVMFMIPRAQASALRINEVLAMESDITDPEDPETGTRGSGTVEFQHVSFAYPGAEEPALSDISFMARPGRITAIIGGTGSGKSTIMNLIPRFYDVTGGHIVLDGVDIRAMRQEDLRSRLGYAPARAVIFTGTIADNIRYGDREASTEAVTRAAEVAQATEFINEMPEGLDSPISQGGANLSGGQKQRLSIARALVRRADVYLFDDTFSALDYRTDARLRQALRREVAGATVIIVAQRVSTVMDADQILVMDEGRLVGAGRHRDLLDSCAVYREIVSSQLSPEEIA